ncbi:MAG: PQQ-binding-like beta-propeller repeat protein [Armatimonadota bacterium]
MTARAMHVAIAVLLAAPGAIPAAADWPMLRADAMRSGIAGEGPGGPVEVLWSADLGGSVDGSPAVVDGKVFVGNSLGVIHAVSAEDGAVLWRFEAGGALVSSPAVVDGIVIVGSADGFIYAVDVESGAQAWCYRTRGAIVSSPAIVDDRVIFGSMDGRLYCLSVSDGSLAWRSERGAGIQSSPAVAGDLVLYGDDEARMRALSLADGSVAWEIEGAGRVVAAPVVGDEVAIFGVMGPSALRPPKVDYLITVRPDTGERVWALNDSYSVLGAPLIRGDSVFFATIEGYVSKTVMRSVALADGELQWERTMPGVIDSSPALIPANGGFEAGGAVCVGCHDGRLYLIDAASGRVADARPLAQKIYSSPAVSDGRVFIGASDGHLYCLGGRE